MIFYKDFKWQQPDYVVDGFPEPRPCPHCGGSAIVENYSVQCQKPWFEKTEACGYNHYDASLTLRKAIEAWNKYDSYSKCPQEELMG